MHLYPDRENTFIDVTYAPINIEELVGHLNEQEYLYLNGFYEYDDIEKYVDERDGSIVYSNSVGEASEDPAFLIYLGCRFLGIAVEDEEYYQSRYEKQVQKSITKFIYVI